MIRFVPMFQEANPGFVRDIVMRLSPQLFIPGDRIIEYGELGLEMYFITKGVVHAMNQQETKIFSVMDDGCFFGEIALLHDSRRTAVVRAHTFAELQKLTKEDFNQGMYVCPCLSPVWMEHVVGGVHACIADTPSTFARSM
jgi:CRP-like cAMP-binding protein